MFYKDILGFLNVEMQPAPVIFCDNKSTLDSCNSWTITKGSRYINVAYHYVRRSYLASDIVLKHIESAKNLAGICTKLLTQSEFVKLSNALIA